MVNDELESRAYEVHRLYQYQWNQSQDDRVRAYGSVIAWKGKGGGGKKSFFRHLHIIDVACCISIRYLQIKFILVHDSFHIGLAPSSRDSQSIPKSLVRGPTLFWNNLRQVRSKSKLENQRYDVTIVLSIAHAWVIDRSSHIIIPICTEILFSKKKCVFDLIGCKTVRRYKSKRFKMTHE